MIDKIFPSAKAALADVADGATVIIGGFGTAGLPNELTDALLAQGASDLTIVNNNAGNGDTGLAALLAKLVPQCSYPLTALGCVSRVYTDLAVIDLGPQGARVMEMCEGLALAQLQALTAVPLLPG